MDDISKLILPVYSGTDHYEGRSFIVAPYLVTAAHVVIDLPLPYVLLENEKYELKSENAISVLYNHSLNEDCAIFKLPQTYQSPFQLADIIPQRQEILTCYCIKQQNRCISASTAKIFHTEEKAFMCYMDPMLCGGDSGSPILNAKNEIVGMLVAGDDKSICAFQSAAFIKNIINNYIEQHII